MSLLVIGFLGVFFGIRIGSGFFCDEVVDVMECNVTVTNETLSCPVCEAPAECVCPVPQPCPSCPVCVECDNSDYVKRMYACELKVQTFERLNNTEHVENLTRAFNNCNLTLHSINESLQSIIGVI